MREINKAKTYSILLRLGVTTIHDAHNWLDSVLSVVNEDEVDMEILVSAVSTSDINELIHLLDVLGGEYDIAIVVDVLQNLISASKSSNQKLTSIINNLESLELIGIDTFADKAGHFKCRLEDCRAGVYGDIQTIKNDFLEYLRSKEKEYLEV